MELERADSTPVAINRYGARNSTTPSTSRASRRTTPRRLLLVASRSRRGTHARGHTRDSRHAHRQSPTESDTVRHRPTPSDTVRHRHPSGTHHRHRSPPFSCGSQRTRRPPELWVRGPSHHLSLARCAMRKRTAPIFRRAPTVSSDLSSSSRYGSLDGHRRRHAWHLACVRGCQLRGCWGELGLSHHQEHWYARCLD